MFIPSIVKSIQRGTVTSGVGGVNTSAISSVNTSLSIVRLVSESALTGPNLTAKFGRLSLASATSVRLDSLGDNVTDTASIQYEVVEFYSFVKSVQQFTITMAAGTISSTSALTSVVTGKTILFYQGAQITLNTSGGNLDDEYVGSLILTSSILVTLTRLAASNNTVKFGGVAVEFR